jgi:crossover junction endodeoxyribonuclease RuvC
MVTRLLALQAAPGTGAADALGIAITHAHAGASLAALQRVSPLARRSHAQFGRGRAY